VEGCRKLEKQHQKKSKINIDIYGELYQNRKRSILLKCSLKRTAHMLREKARPKIL
jgi:hypothetical protein